MGKRHKEDPNFTLPHLPPSHEAASVGLWDRWVTGEVFVHGSLLYGAYEGIKRAGWAFATLDEVTFKHAMFGPLPLEQWQQRMFAADLWAVYQALVVAVVPLVIYSGQSSRAPREAQLGTIGQI